MGNDKLKNMIVLKNLPSNVIEEAIVILKPNIRLKKTDYADKKSKNTLSDKKLSSKEYIVNEAQMVISSYISNIEKPKREKFKQDSKIRSECKKLKIMSIGLFVLLILSFFIKR
jgi:hypothetical protein